jgi:hypothetical protein
MASSAIRLQVVLPAYQPFTAIRSGLDFSLIARRLAELRAQIEAPNAGDRSPFDGPVRQGSIAAGGNGR